MLTAVSKMTDIPVCKKCSCSNFVKHSNIFKKGICNNCLHDHRKEVPLTEYEIYRQKLEERNSKLPPCSVCGNKTLVSTAMGKPGPHLMKAANQGLIHLGGCKVTLEKSKLHCTTCDALTKYID